MARQIADGLEAAHENGIIHRDLKPANIKVRPDGVVKVLDFGLAKALDPSGSRPDVANSPTLTAHATQMGVILGTAAYMAPEQNRGRAVDRRADIWAFGAVLYEMLAGRRAFEADDVSCTLAAVLKDNLDWSRLPADTPASVRRLLARCLTRDPRERLRDIGDARFELLAIDTHSIAPLVPVGARRITIERLGWAVAVVAANRRLGLRRARHVRVPRCIDRHDRADTAALGAAVDRGRRVLVIGPPSVLTPGRDEFPAGEAVRPSGPAGGLRRISSAAAPPQRCLSTRLWQRHPLCQRTSLAA